MDRKLGSNERQKARQRAHRRLKQRHLWEYEDILREEFEKLHIERGTLRGETAIEWDE